MNKALAMRPDLLRIARWIKPNSRVLDLGCGSGDLLKYLQQHKNVTGVGIEISDKSVIDCMSKNVPVIQQNLEEGLALFEDQQFDTVVLSKTLQSMRNTEDILKEMARVAKFGIVSFPNFGHWTHPFSILFQRMPVSTEMPYQWYNTPNIHLCTMHDFEVLAQQLDLTILSKASFANGRTINVLPSLRGTLAVYYFQSSFN